MLLVFFLVLFLIQLFLDSSFENCIVALLCSSHCYLFVLFCRKFYRPIRERILSFLFVAGSFISYFLFPLLFVSLELKPLSTNLESPVQVFLVSSLLSFISSISWLIYTVTPIHGPLIRPIRRVWKRLGFYRRLSSKILNRIFFLSAFSFFILTFLANAGLPSFVLKLLEGLRVFSGSYAVIYVSYSFGLVKTSLNTSHSSLLSNRFLSIYIALQIAVSLLANSRTAVVFTVYSIFTIFVLKLLIERFSFSLLRKAVPFLLCALFLFPIADRLSNSILISRSGRSSLSNVEMALSTLNLFFSGDDLSSSVSQSSVYVVDDQTHKYDESYVASSLGSRLARAKLISNSYQFSLDLPPSSRDFLSSYLNQRILSIFPSPLLFFLDSSLDKNRILESSYGDVLYSVNINSDLVLGGKRSAHMAGANLSVLDLFTYPFVMIPLLFILYTLLDTFSFPASLTNSRFLPIPLLLLSPAVMNLPNVEIFIDLISFIIRQLPETIFFIALFIFS